MKTKTDQLKAAKSKIAALEKENLYLHQKIARIEVKNTSAKHRELARRKRPHRTILEIAEDVLGK